MCSTYTSKKAFQNLQLLRSHPRTRYLWRRLPWLSCGVIFEADILTEIVMHLTCLLFKVLLLSMFFCTCATLFFLKVSLLTKTKKNRSVCCTGKEKAAESQEKCSFNGGVFLKENTQRKLHHDIFQTPDRLVRRRRKFQRKRAKKRRKQEP